MTTISDIGKVAYIYNEATSTWHPVAGMIDKSAAFAWTGTQSFSNTVNLTNTLVSTKGINVFANTAARDAAIPSPTNGVIAITTINNIPQMQYYNSGWRSIGDNAFLEEKTDNYTLTTSDSGKTIEVNTTVDTLVTIPLDLGLPNGSQIAFIQNNTGRIVFTPGTSGVTINSKNSNKKTSARYTQAILIKKSSNVWYLFGDLTA